MWNYQSYLRQFHHDVIPFLVSTSTTFSFSFQGKPGTKRCNSFSGFYIYNMGSFLGSHSASAASGSLWFFESIAPLIRLYMRKWYYRITACLPKSAVEMSAARCPIGSNSVSTLEYEIKILVLLRICSWCSWSSSFQHHSYRGVVERRDRAVLTLSELVLLHWQSWSRILYLLRNEPSIRSMFLKQRSLVIVFNLYSASCCDLFSLLELGII